VFPSLFPFHCGQSSMAVSTLSSYLGNTLTKVETRCYSPHMAIDRERIRRMAAAGFTNREIASELGCSHTRVNQVLAASEPIEVTATIRATKSQVIIDTSDAQVTGVAVRRALERAGILLSDAGQSSGPPSKPASNRNKEG
jgi:hypothetical protein